LGLSRDIANGFEPKNKQNEGRGKKAQKIVPMSRRKLSSLNGTFTEEFNSVQTATI
jgi:hypothetical protein